MARAHGTGSGKPPRGGSGRGKKSASRGGKDRGGKDRGGKGSPWANARTRRSSGGGSSSSAPSSGRPSGKTAAKTAKKKDAERPTPPAATAASPVASAVQSGADVAVTFKLQKYLADAGLGSRRELERWIVAGRIEVNGSKATLGDRVSGSERISVDGKPLRERSGAANPRVLLLNKAQGVICTRRDPEGRKTVFADLPALRGGRWISIGRLDVATTGLLLVTNDGELAHRMMHPSTGLDREYAVRIDTVLEDEALAQLKKGVESDGEILRFADIRYFDGRGNNHWYHVVLLEGKNHEVRRLFAAAGAEVRRLKRVRYGPVLLPSWLRRGQRFELNNRDLSQLYATLGLPISLPPEKPGRRGDRRNLADRSVLIAYPELPGVAEAKAEDRPINKGTSD